MFEEYPKVITVGGVRVTVADAKDEARWRAGETLFPGAVDPEPSFSVDFPFETPADALDVIHPEPEKPKAKKPKKHT